MSFAYRALAVVVCLLLSIGGAAAANSNTGPYSPPTYQPKFERPEAPKTYQPKLERPQPPTTSGPTYSNKR
jgi:hypothetical protein